MHVMAIFLRLNVSVRLNAHVCVSFVLSFLWRALQADGGFTADPVPNLGVGVYAAEDSTLCPA